MKMRMLFVSAMTLACLGLRAQTRYVDASLFPVFGQVAPQSTARYERLPASLEPRIRPALWQLGRNSAGLAIRFRSNTTQVRLRWENLNGFSMNHMTDTGVRGFDLYARLDGGEWRFAGSARPGRGKSNDMRIVANMSPEEREYVLYLPLYDGVTKAEIGVDSTATISQPAVADPARRKPLVFYGTSILQGGCATRPGMAFTNIIERRLHRECVNLGFSGNGQLDLDIARLMATADAGAFILDFVPNCTVRQMQDSMMTFYDIIRRARPETPMLFVEQAMYTNGRFDRKTWADITRKNEAFDSIFAIIRKRDKNVRLLKSTDIIGHDDEATVDGTHFTDLGMMRYADILTPLLGRMMRHDH